MLARIEGNHVILDEVPTESKGFISILAPKEAGKGWYSLEIRENLTKYDLPPGVEPGSVEKVLVSDTAEEAEENSGSTEETGDNSSTESTDDQVI